MTIEYPFSMWIGDPAPVEVMTTPDYNYARKSAIRRVTSQWTPGKEAPEQPVIGQVKAGGEVIFQLRRLVRESPKSGEPIVRFVVDRDWQYEQSPFIRREIDISDFERYFA